MGIRKISAWVIAASFSILLTACSAPVKKPAMYIEKAQMSKQEEKIVQLLGANIGTGIFDFKLDNTVKSVQVNTYQLSNGQWNRISGGGGQQFSDKNGRLALEFENISQGLRVALQSEKDCSSTKYTTEPDGESTGMGRTTSYLDDTTEVSYEQEIPLAIQISTAQDTIRSFTVEHFFKPEEYDKYGYEHVYAVTVCFSQKAVNELETAE